MRGFKGAAAGIDVAETYRIAGLLRLGSLEEAQQVVTEAKAWVEKARVALDEEIKREPAVFLAVHPAYSVLNRLRFASEGSDVRASVEASQSEIANVLFVVTMAEAAEAMSAVVFPD